jgi:hypothetical protein
MSYRFAGEEMLPALPDDECRETGRAATDAGSSLGNRRRLEAN